MFLSLYLYYFIRPTGAADILDLLVVLFPLMVGAWVGMTRVIDNYHNPSDVLAGVLFLLQRTLLPRVNRHMCWASTDTRHSLRTPHNSAFPVYLRFVPLSLRWLGCALWPTVLVHTMHS
jgi:membrane-associated phospholipid phosphatase